MQNNKQAKRFFIALGIALLLAYGLAMTVSTIYFLRRNHDLDRKMISLELLRQDTEVKMKAISSEISSLQKQRSDLQKTLSELNENSKKETKQVSIHLEEHKKQIQRLNKELQNTKNQLANLRNKNQQPKISSSKTAEDKTQESKLNQLLAEKENELSGLHEQVMSLVEQVKEKETAIHYNLAVNFFQRGDLNNSFIEYNEALRIDPDHCPSHYNLGILYEEYKQDYVSAINCYRRYIEFCPNAGDVASVKQWILNLESYSLGAVVE